MKKLARVAAILAVVAVVVLAFHTLAGDLLAQGGQLIYWQLGLHRAGALVIAAGDSLACFRDYVTPVAALVL